uniref:WAP domain-containing protein n=1 Tax=Steinernema glaseri TaxID=37863 RepID=A0A1I8ART2_9BILA
MACSATLILAISLGKLASRTGRYLSVATASASPVQSALKFVYDSPWRTCFALKDISKLPEYTPTFNTKTECEAFGKASMDGSPCFGPYSGVDPKPKGIWTGDDCNIAECPEEYVCKNGLSGGECCVPEHEKLFREGTSDKCPNGKKAGGATESGVFHVIVAESCKDLICGKNEECVQVNKFFAKCCGK